MAQRSSRLLCSSPWCAYIEANLAVPNDQWFAGIGPFERLGHGLVEVLHELDQRLAQLVGGLETAALQQASGQDAEPNLDLIEPGGVLWGVDEADAMTGIGQESGPAGHGLEDAVFLLDPQVHVKPTLAGHLPSTRLAD